MKGTLVTTTAPHSETPEVTPYSLKGSHVGTLLRIAMDHYDTFFGKRLVRAFLNEHVNGASSGFIPHVPPDFVSHCLSNPTEPFCQVCLFHYYFYHYFRLFYLLFNY